MAGVAWRVVHILLINSGSSSIKFSIFDAAEGAGNGWPRVLFAGEISGVGTAKLGFTFRDAQGRELASDDNPSKDPVSLLEETICRPGMPVIDAVGYRVVHPGALLQEHQRIT